jgi:predicted nuclease with TOPRIM domain
MSNKKEDENKHEYVLKRQRNNESVRKCRSAEKEKIKMTKEKLEKFKNENKLLDEKLANMKKELQVLKSLFDTSAAPPTAADTFSATASSSSASDTGNQDDGIVKSKPKRRAGNGKK